MSSPPVEFGLPGIDWWRRNDLAQARDVFSMHQIGANESSEFEKAVLFLGELLQQSEQQEQV